VVDLEAFMLSKRNVQDFSYAEDADNRRRGYVRKIFAACVALLLYSPLSDVVVKLFFS
jgi:hypothetical protein